VTNYTFAIRDLFLGNAFNFTVTFGVERSIPLFDYITYPVIFRIKPNSNLSIYVCTSIYSSLCVSYSQRGVVCVVGRLDRWNAGNCRMTDNIHDRGVVLGGGGGGVAAVVGLD
jgi:hypothetical protein